MLRTPRGTHPLLTGFLLGLLAAVANPLTVGVLAALALPEVRTETVSGDAMAPTLSDDEVIFIDRGDKEPERGDIVHLGSICGGAHARESDFLRVVGLPGETVHIEGGVTIVDGSPLDEEYVQSAGSESYPEVTLGDGEYYVLADDRTSTADLDSRECGPATEILGTLRDSAPPTWAGITIAVVFAAGFAAAGYIMAQRRGRSGWWAVMGLWMWGAVVLALWLMGREHGPEPADFGQGA